MTPCLHQKQNVSELEKFDILSCFQRMSHEERDDAFDEMIYASHPVRHPISMIASDDAAAEVCLEGMQYLCVAFVLNYGEFRQYLIPCRHFIMPVYTDMKTAFTVHEADYPLCIEVHLEGILPNMKSLRVPDIIRPSLRIVPVYAGFLLHGSLSVAQYLKLYRIEGVTVLVPDIF